jgi:2-phosphoglycerate kinase
MAVIIDNKKRIPFLRGMLTHYLIEHAFSFEEAYEVADSVRSAMSKTEEISREVALEMILQSVNNLYGDRSFGDGVFWEPGGGKEIIVEDAEGRRPFSRARVSHSLTLAGVDDSRAYKIAEDMLSSFRMKGKYIVTRDQVREAARKFLRETGGELVAERYECWHEFRNADPPRSIIILLGGTSGVGKTSICVALANLLKITRVASTDEIRQVMRLMISPELMPTLHKSSYAAWESFLQLGVDSGDPLIPAFHEQANRVCVGVRATIERALEEGASLVIDGVHLLPEVLDLKPYKDRATFVFANLYISDSKLYRARFKLRGKQASFRPQHRYFRYMKEILKLQSHILEMGEANKVPAFENNDFDETIQSLSLHIIDTLRKASK